VGWQDGMVAADGSQRRLGFATVLWALIPVLTIGLLAFLPSAHAAVKLRGRRMWLPPAAYAAATVVVFGPLGAASNTSDAGALAFTGAWFALILVATVHAFMLRRRVFSPPEVQPAMAAALAERKLREQARAIVARDPALARELRIGRPDLPRQFDDGGLVDVNHVPERVLVERLGFAPAQAAQVVEARERLGAFTAADEVCVFAEVPDAIVDAVRERLLFLAVD
jgi:hypothetical protein